MDVRDLLASNNSPPCHATPAGPGPHPGPHPGLLLLAAALDGTWGAVKEF